MHVESTVLLLGVKRCSSEIYLRFVGKYSLYLRGGRVAKQETSRSMEQDVVGILKMWVIYMNVVLLPASSGLMLEPL
jgi:hypothetical protein